MRKVRKVEPVAQPLPARKRVAAYARVSGANELNLQSLSAQVSYYSNYIQKQRGWEYAGVYADESLTGTSDKRPEFQRLMDDCRNGKIDIVLTKSISRFARNTVTMLEVVRELKALNIDVWFERENIHSLSGDGELMLTILASFAQEESRSTSENMKWRIQKKFKEGLASNVNILGYKFVDGTFVIIPDEAKIVQRIFSDFLNGMAASAIAKKLNEDGVPTKRCGIWRETVISRILRNEKYAGKLVLQKYFRPDHISGKTSINHGELPKYNVLNSHKPIIEPDIFDQVQTELARRAALKPRNNGVPVKYQYSGKIVCGICGKRYFRKDKYRETKYANVVWVCATKGKLGKKACPSQQIPEYILNDIHFDFEKITVTGVNTLTITMMQGNEETIVNWEHQTRSAGWSEEMRQAAREKALAQHAERRASECPQEQ